MTDHDWGKVGIGGCFGAMFGIEALVFGQNFGFPLVIVGTILMIVALFFHEPY